MLNLADEVGKVFGFFEAREQKIAAGAAVCWRRVSGCGLSVDAASGDTICFLMPLRSYANRRDELCALPDGRSPGVLPIVKPPGAQRANTHRDCLTVLVSVDPSRS